MILVAALGLVALMMIEEGYAPAAWGVVTISSGPSRHGELLILAVAAVVVAGLPRRCDLPVLAPALGILLLLAVAAARAGASAGPAASTAALVLVVASAARLDRRRLERVVTVLLVLLVVISIALFLAGVERAAVPEGAASERLLGLLPGVLDLGRARGVFRWPSGLAAAGGILILIGLKSVTRRDMRRSIVGVLIGSGSGAILLSDGMTALFALGAALLAAGASRRLAGMRLGSGVWPLLYASIAAVCVMIFPVAIAVLGRPSLTGRMILWRRILDEITPLELVRGVGHRPLAQLGHRLGVDWGPVHAHHTGLDLTLTTGVAGAVLFCALIVALLVSAQRATAETSGHALGFAVFWVLNGLTTAQLYQVRPQQVLILAVTLLLVLSRDAERPPQSLA